MTLMSLLWHDVFQQSPGESGFHGAIADRYKVRAGEFRSSLQAIDAARVVVVRDALPPGDGRRLAITVDDGGSSFAGVIADELEARGWRGHAFVSTDRIGTAGFLSAADIRALDARGHVIGSHSASHPSRFSACSWERMVEEWRVSRARLEDIVGHPVRVASLPGGYLSRQAALAASIAGIRVLFTSEPVTRGWQVADCTLLGRYTVLPGESPDALAALAAGLRRPLARQWVTWNVKKLAKPLLGPAYPRLAAWLLSK